MPTRFRCVTLATLLSTNLVSAGLAFLAPSQALANEFDLRISDDALHVNLTANNEQSALAYGGGFFYKDADDSISLLNVDLHSQGQTALGNLPTTVLIGVQGSYFKEDQLEGAGLGLGGSARVNIPELPGLSVESALHFAPDVLAFDDAKRFSRFRGQLNYRIIQTADLSAGYRHIKAKLTTGEKTTFESGWFLGLRLNF